ncbi:MAG: mandelate racemase/muconate lactonizing enzyme family protein [Bryobacterales bacterium]|nr:mandelate racemase/muconate lactonizing enzyme family protein [Bryobacterales bacterium]
MLRRDLWKLPAAALGFNPAAAAGESLKIVKVEAFVIRTPGNPVPPDQLIEMPAVGAMTGGTGLWNRLDHASPSRFKGYTQATLVRITTSAGITGWGECHAPAAPRVHKTVISDLLAPILLGQNALDIDPLWEKMYSSQRTRGYATGFFMESIAGVDLALWDIFGKHAGLPLYRLLGGKYRDRIPTYTGVGGASAEQLKENALRAVERGFQAVKMGLSKGPGTRDLDRVAAVAAAVQGKAQVFVDSLGAYKLHEAVKVGRELDRIGNLGWWEDPLMPDDLSGYPKLAEALDTPICAGEMCSNRFQFRDLFASKSVDIINPDVCRAGGISECRRIAVLADAHEILWSPHVSTGTAPYISASVHLAAATPNFVIMEGGGALAGPFGNILLKEPLEYQPGFVRVPERPGLGVEFNETELAKVMVG